MGYIFRIYYIPNMGSGIKDEIENRIKRLPKNEAIGYWNALHADREVKSLEDAGIPKPNSSLKSRLVVYPEVNRDLERLPRGIANDRIVKEYSRKKSRVFDKKEGHLIKDGGIIFSKVELYENEDFNIIRSSKNMSLVKIRKLPIDSKYEAKRGERFIGVYGELDLGPNHALMKEDKDAEPNKYSELMKAINAKLRADGKDNFGLKFEGRTGIYRTNNGLERKGTTHFTTPLRWIFTLTEKRKPWQYFFHIILSEFEPSYDEKNKSGILEFGLKKGLNAHLNIMEDGINTIVSGIDGADLIHNPDDNEHDITKKLENKKREIMRNAAEGFDWSERDRISGAGPLRGFGRRYGVF